MSVEKSSKNPEANSSADESMLDQMFERLNNASNFVGESTSKESVWDFAKPSSPSNTDWANQDPVDTLQATMELGSNFNGPTGDFHPLAPISLEHAQVQSDIVESIILRFLLGRGSATIRTCAEVLKLNYGLVQPVMKFLQDIFLVEFTGTDSTNDYICRLTDEGKTTALKRTKISSYVGSAPVALSEYIKSVKLQSIESSNPSLKSLQDAFEDLNVSEEMLHRLGPAVASAKGLFLYGSPGNGKTSIAERISTAFGELIWIPRAVQIEGEIIRLFDPSVHTEVPLTAADSENPAGIDRRWVRIKRATVVVGGELSLDMLDIRKSNGIGVSEAPVQMKSNCGVLVIDDFGRQRCSVEELLNRWIVPLEKRYDFLNTVAGHRICMPFDQLVIFSTNLEPNDLVDEAFLRRIPYKIEVDSPSVEQYKEVWKWSCEQNGLEYDEECFDYLIESCYTSKNREFRMCHPRDLIHQILNYCKFLRIEPQVTKANIDIATANYFATLG